MKHLKNWKPLKKLLKPVLILLGLVVIAALTHIDYGCDWTGFGRCVVVKQNNEEIRLAKSLK